MYFRRECGRIENSERKEIICVGSKPGKRQRAEQKAQQQKAGIEDKDKIDEVVSPQNKIQALEASAGPKSKFWSTPPVKKTAALSRGRGLGAKATKGIVKKSAKTKGRELPSSNANRAERRKAKRDRMKFTVPSK